MDAQRGVNKIGEAIAASVPLAVQKLIAHTAFPAMCSVSLRHSFLFSF